VQNTNKALFRYAAFAALCTLLLICVGGVVTSKGVGMAVPDWPTTYGYNMFLFPFDKWIGGIFWEHLHRLEGSIVGLLTVLLAVWIWRKEPRAWVQKLAWIAVGLVVFQGLLGGLRVVFDKAMVANTTFGTLFGVAHACTGQAFFVLMCLIAFVLSGAWARLDSCTGSISPRLSWLIPLATSVIFLQLALGAAMRHQHSGLAVPDFPLAYGQLWPATDAASLLRYNQQRVDTNVITSFEIGLHMFHRVNACLAAVLIFWVALEARKNLGPEKPLLKPALLWCGLVACQWVLGITTVLKDKPADIATAHVAVGALTLGTGGLLIAACRRILGAALPNRTASGSSVPKHAWAINAG